MKFFLSFFKHVPAAVKELAEKCFLGTFKSADSTPSLFDEILQSLETLLSYLGPGLNRLD